MLLGAALVFAGMFSSVCCQPHLAAVPVVCLLLWLGDGADLHTGHVVPPAVVFPHRNLAVGLAVGSPHRRVGHRLGPAHSQLRQPRRPGWCRARSGARSIPILAEVVGIAEAGSTFGAICFALVLPTTLCEAIALQLVTGDGPPQFLPSQIFVGLMFLAGATSLWFLRTWKISEIERKAEDEQRSVLVDMEAAGTAAIRGVRSSFWLTPRRMFMPRRV
ncbi:hypothetical protein VTK56DRAFT_7538 [Thermocarpiscus australiensis]